MHSRMVMIGVLLLCLVATAFASNVLLPKMYGEGKTISMVTDTTADSTKSSGEVGVPLGDGTGYDALMGRVIIDGPKPIPANSGAGLDDSVWIWVVQTWLGERHVLDSVIQEGLPCTLRVMHPAAAGSDTLIKGMLGVEWAIYDSTADTTVTLDYTLRYFFSWE